MDKLEIKRGDIIFVDNPQSKRNGNVMYGNHPAVVIQNNIGNEHSNTLIIAYITSALKRLEMPTHVVIQWYGGLRNTSVIQTEQISTISKNDVISVVDELREEDLKRLDRAIVASLALEKAV